MGNCSCYAGRSVSTSAGKAGGHRDFVVALPRSSGHYNRAILADKIAVKIHAANRIHATRVILKHVTEQALVRVMRGERKVAKINHRFKTFSLVIGRPALRRRFSTYRVVTRFSKAVLDPSLR